jgi:hypothetical protein
MLNKEFSLSGSFPYTLDNGTLVIKKDRYVPTSMNRAAAHQTGNVIRINPQLKYPIKFYGVTHVKDNVRLVSMSDGSKTRYYWFGENCRGTYLCNTPSSSFEESWRNLFKSLMLDDCSKAIKFYDLVKGFFSRYFETLGSELFQLSITGKWKGLFVHLDFERSSALDSSLIFMNVHDKEILANLNTHPLVELLG